MVSKYMIKPKPQPTKVLKVKMYFSSSFMLGQGLHTLNYLIPNPVSLIMPAGFEQYFCAICHLYKMYNKGLARVENYSILIDSMSINEEKLTIVSKGNCFHSQLFVYN